MHSSRTKYAIFASLAILSCPVAAHHSFSAEFDPKQLSVYEGVVTKVEWTNPHVYFYAVVRVKDGQAVLWAFEAAGPNLLARLGWDRNSLKAGDHVKVVGYPARDGANVASARSVLLSGGRKVFANSNSDGGPQP